MEDKTDVQELECLLLRKTPYGESSVIVKVLTAEGTLVSLMAYGVFIHGKNAFPELEMFRRLRIMTAPGRGELRRIASVEILEDFGQVAARYERYRAACWIAGFTVLNVMPEVPHPLYANAVSVGLRRLCGDGGFPEDAVLTGVALSFLFEEGWLASMLEIPETSRQLRCILEMAAGKEELPPVTAESWRQQLEWCHNALLMNDCRLPC